MRLGVISDIHGNATALEAVLASLAERAVERIVCLGDVVGYGAEPDLCVRLVRASCAACIAGNHDRAVIDTRSLAWFNADAAEALLWTARALPAESRDWLAELPTTDVVEGVLLCHGAPSNPDRYLFDCCTAEAEFRAFAERVALFGHTHLPALYAREEAGGEVVHRVPAETEGATLDLAPTARLLLNPGSVGQPRDRDPRAAALILDLDAHRAEFVRAEYDIAHAQALMAAAGLPPRLVRRIAHGV